MNTIATVENLSPLPRRRWVSFFVPTAAVRDLPEHCTFAATPHRPWRAVLGRTQGNRTLVHVQADIDGHETLRGELTPEEFDSAPFRFHPWVSDDFEKLVPSIDVSVDGKIVRSSPVETKLVEQDGARQRWYHKCATVFGLVLEWWADIYTDDCIVDVWGKLTWSDRFDTSWNRSFDAIMLRTGEALKLDYEAMHGIHNPHQKDSTGRYVVLLGGPIGLNDGASLPLSGSMLCFKDGNRDSSDVERDIENIMACDGGPVLMSSHSWEGQFLPVGRLAPVELQPTLKEADDDWREFETRLENLHGWFARRPIGITKTPGQTGNQEDFGVTKGTHVTVHHQPRHIYRMRWGVQGDFFRGVTLLESDLDPVRASERESWVTWNGRTHFHHGVSRDRLNKESPRPPATGWYGYDNQHRSQNNLAAYLMLCDDPAAASLVEPMIELDLADYRHRYPNYGAGAPRAIGRTMGAWANLHFVTANDDLVTLMQANVARARNQMQALSGNKPMQVLGVIGPDGRYPVYVDGKLSKAVSVWEHGLALAGLYVGYKAIGPSPWLEELMTKVSEFLAVHAVIEDTQGFATFNGVAWADGDPVPGGMVRDNPALLPGTGGVGGWTIAGLLVAREWLPNSHPEWDKLDRFLKAAVPDKLPSTYWGEWYALVAEIGSVPAQQ